MSNVPKRTELNASLYATLDAKKNDEFTKDFKQVEPNNEQYFQSVLNNINQAAKIDELYINQTLNTDEKYLEMHKQISLWNDELRNIIHQNNLNNSSTLENGIWYNDTTLEIEILDKSVLEVPNIRTINERVSKSINNLYTKDIMVSAKARFRKELKNINDNDEYKDLLKVRKTESIGLMSTAKKILNTYKTKWLWYVIPLIVLVIGAILCIVIPLYA